METSLQAAGQHLWRISPLSPTQLWRIFFKRATDTKHLTVGFVFSKTKKFETSGKPIQSNLLPDYDNNFLPESHTRPAMKQAKRI